MNELFLTETERFLLGRMLSSKNAAEDAVFSLRPEDFQEGSHRAIFQACCLAIKRDFKVEPLTILSILQEIKPGEADFGVLNSLTYYAFGDDEETKSFIHAIKKASMLRQIVQLSQIAIDKAQLKGAVPETLQSEIMENLNQVFSNSLKKTTFKAHEIVENFEGSGCSYSEVVEKRMEEYRQGVRTMRGIPLHYPKLDKLMQGISNGHFIIVGARPGAGKSTFMCNWIHRLITKSHCRVGFFSMEMTKEQVASKILGIASKVNSEKVEEGSLNPDEFMRIHEAQEEFKNYPLIIEEQDALPVSQFIARARRMIATDGVNVIFLDYLTRLKGEGRFNSKQEEVMSISKALCAFAKEANIPLICIAQLNRDVEKSEAKRAPRKSDLAQSGQIEADAHSILMLYRPAPDKEYDVEGKEIKTLGNLENLLKVFIVKNRFGKEGVVDFYFDGSTGIYEEIDYRVRDDAVEQREDNSSKNDTWDAFTPPGYR